MVLYILIFAAQVVCALHAVRSGRSQTWVYIIVFAPLVGMAVYLLAEVLPELLSGPRARQATVGVAKALDPGKPLRQAERELAIADTPENRIALARLHLAAGRNDEAIQLFREAMTGLHATDPAVLLGLARAHFARGEPAETQAALERLRETNPRVVSHEGHLLYARALEEQGKLDEALHEYEHLALTYPGQEARYRYACLLRLAGREAEARRALQEICRAADLAPRHVWRLQKPWFEQARRDLAA